MLFSWLSVQRCLTAEGALASDSSPVCGVDADNWRHVPKKVERSLPGLGRLAKGSLCGYGEVDLFCV